MFSSSSVSRSIVGHEVLVGLALVRIDDGLDAGPGFLEVLALDAGLLGLLDGGIGGVGQGVRSDRHSS